MAVTRIGVLLGACVLLTACEEGLPSSAYRPASADFDKSLPSAFPLKGKIVLGTVTTALGKYAMITPKGFQPELGAVLKKAHMLTVDKEKAQYVLNARIMDYRWPSTGMMHVTCGAAVAYRLVTADSEREVFSKR